MLDIPYPRQKVDAYYVTVRMIVCLDRRNWITSRLINTKNVTQFDSS